MCARGARAEEARAISAAMKMSACRPDSLTHTSLATACQRCGDWVGALKVGLLPRFPLHSAAVTEHFVLMPAIYQNAPSGLPLTHRRPEQDLLHSMEEPRGSVWVSRSIGLHVAAHARRCCRTWWRAAGARTRRCMRR